MRCPLSWLSTAVARVPVGRWRFCWRVFLLRWQRRTARVLLSTGKAPEPNGSYSSRIASSLVKRKRTSGCVRKIPLSLKARKGSSSLKSGLASERPRRMCREQHSRRPKHPQTGGHPWSASAQARRALLMRRASLTSVEVGHLRLRSANLG